MSFGNFLQDKSLTNGIFFLDLLSAVEPRVVNWNLVTNGGNGTFNCYLNNSTCTCVLEVEAKLSFCLLFIACLASNLQFYSCSINLQILTLFFFPFLWNRWREEVKCYLHYQRCTKAGLFHFLVTWGHNRGKIQMAYFSAYSM